MIFALHDPYGRRPVSLEEALRGSWVRPSSGVRASRHVTEGERLLPSTLTAASDQPPHHPARFYAASGGQTPRQPHTVGAIMQRPVETLPAAASLDAALHLFARAGFHHVPLLDEHGRLTGIISDRDVLRARVRGMEGEHPLAEIMQRAVLTTVPHAELRLVARVMLEQRIGALPVLDAEDQLAGILSRSDLLRALAELPLEAWA